MKNKLAIPKRMELLFDSFYLITVFILGIYLSATKTSSIGKLWGVMALVLAFGDSFHLMPRMAAAYSDDKERFRSIMGLGKLFTSITMTIFYLLLWHGGLMIFEISLPVHTVIIYILAVIRISLCLLPKNGWTKIKPDYRFGIYRNIPFFIQGMMVLWLYAWQGSTENGFNLMWLAIFLSFAFYLPVVLYADRNPKLGMMMLPKSCAYVWIVCMGLGL